MKLFLENLLLDLAACTFFLFLLLAACIFFYELGTLFCTTFKLLVT